MTQIRDQAYWDNHYKEMKKKYGDRYEKSTLLKPLEFIGTGFPMLDYAIGGGIPRGRIVEIYGNNGVGKTTLTMQIAGRAIKGGDKVLFVDTEGTYPRHLIDNNIEVYSPESGEDAVNKIVESIDAGFKLIILDSVPATVPLYELETGAEQSSVAKHARLINKLIRMTTGALSREKATLVLINQLRATIGSFMSSDITTGGMGLPYACSLRLELKAMAKKDYIMDGDDIVLRPVKFKIVKTKMRWGNDEGHLYLNKNGKYSQLMDILIGALESKVINKNGAFIKYGDINLGQGLIRAASYLDENKDLIKIILEQLLDRLNVKALWAGNLFAEEDKKLIYNKAAKDYNEKWNSDIELYDIKDNKKKKDENKKEINNKKEKEEGGFTEKGFDLSVSYSSIENIIDKTGKGKATIYRWRKENKILEKDNLFYLIKE